MSTSTATSAEGDVASSTEAPSAGSSLTSDSVADSTSSSVSTDDGSGEPSPCTESHVGDLVLATQADVEAQGFLREVQGTLTITGAVTSLDPLGCLETIRGHLYVQETHGLQDLIGLGRLAEIGGQLHATQNPGLQSLAGLTSLRFIQVLRLSQNGLTSLELSDLQAAGEIVIGGWCGAGGEGEPLLEDFDSLDSLLAISRVTIYDSPSLTGLSGIEAFAERGGSMSGLELWFNEQLAPGLIAEVANTFAQHVYVDACENGGETDNPCSCKPTG